MTPADRIAVRAWNLLATGMGGLDWAGFTWVVEYLGVDDPDDLMHRLETMRTHRPPERWQPQE